MALIDFPFQRDFETGEDVTSMSDSPTHGSAELDADAAKLQAMGADPGMTLQDITPLFIRATDEKLVENGFDPASIEDLDKTDPDGPFRLFTQDGETCRCCGAEATGYGLVDIETGTEWRSPMVGAEAREHAEELMEDCNRLWCLGRLPRDELSGKLLPGTA